MGKAAGLRLNVTLDPEYAEKLRHMAQQAYMQEGTLARALLSRAIDEAELDGGALASLLSPFPAARQGGESARGDQTA